MNNLFFEQLSINEFLSYYNKLSENDLINIINSGCLENVSDEVFRTFFLRSSNNIKMLILEHDILYKRVINISPSHTGRVIFELVNNINDSDGVLEKILCSEWAFLYVDLIFDYCKTVDNKLFNKIINITNSGKASFIPKMIKLINEYMTNKLNYDSYVIDLFNNRVKEGLNPLYFSRTKNEKELFILSKFLLLVNVKVIDDDNILINNKVFSYNILKRINTKQITKIINVFKEKNRDVDEDIFVAALTLYGIFGYDNTYKIVRDYFTFLTPSAINRIGDNGFKDERREYRLSHQMKFYYYGIEEDTIKAIENSDINFFSNFLIFTSDREKFLLMQMIKDEIAGKDFDTQKKIIKNILVDKINMREENFKKIYMASLKRRLDNKPKKDIVTAKDIVLLFSNCNYPITLDSSNNVVIDEQLQTFLLGNFKKDNDALLRIILNKEAWGLNTTIDQVINNFGIFKRIVEKTNGTLSLYSILDIIDISKTCLYQLEPDLLDITLETLSKIIKSRTFCVEKEDAIIKKVFALHRKTKEKVYASIPTIKGRTSEFDYVVAPFDSEFLLRAGVDVGNCMKMGAIGGDFLDYCLTNEQAIMVYLTDNYGKTYICPFVRSGNGIHCNGIEPEPPIEKLNDIFDVLKVFGKNICDSSVKNGREHFQNIEIVTVSDLHIKDYMKHHEYEIYHLEEPIPLNTQLYTDYNKSNINHYVLYKTKTYKSNHYYLSCDKFFQKRPAVFKYDVLEENDQERISIIVNSILYSDIDYMPITMTQKQMLKKNFQNIDVTNFIYIEGNKDWFIAIDKEGKIISRLLPWDIRARFEYMEALKSTYNVFNVIMDGDQKKLKKL